jgi:hypothetical protein
MNNTQYLHSIGVIDPELHKECHEAMAKYGDNHWWEPDVDKRTMAYYQIQEPIQLVMPFSRFREAIKILLGRSVWTHEFGLNEQGLIEEARAAWKGDIPSDEERKAFSMDAFKQLTDYAEQTGNPIIAVIPSEEMAE